MSEPEMIDRVAKEIAFAGGDDFYEDEKWFRKMARAAIAAMREPTEAMRLAAYEAVETDERWDIADDERWAKSYRAGINAALSPPPDTKSEGKP